MDSGASGLDARVTAVEDMQDDCGTLTDEYGHDAFFTLEAITHKTPRGKRYKSTGKTKGQFQAELRQAKALCKEAHRLVKTAVNRCSDAEHKLDKAWNNLPDDDDARLERAELIMYPMDDPSDEEWDEMIDNLDNAERNLEYLI